MPTWPALRTMRSIDRMPAVHRTPAEHEYPAVIIHTLDINTDPSLDRIRISLKFSLQLLRNASYRAQSLILAKSWDLIDKYDLVWLISTISIRCAMPYLYISLQSVLDLNGIIIFSNIVTKHYRYSTIICLGHIVIIFQVFNMENWEHITCISIPISTNHLLVLIWKHI